MVDTKIVMHTVCMQQKNIKRGAGLFLVSQI
jgi:hypothetical protein